MPQDTQTGPEGSVADMQSDKGLDNLQDADTLDDFENADGDEDWVPNEDAAKDLMPSEDAGDDLDPNEDTTDELDQNEDDDNDQLSQPQAAQEDDEEPIEDEPQLVSDSDAIDVGGTNDSDLGAEQAGLTDADPGIRGSDAGLYISGERSADPTGDRATGLGAFRD